MCDVEDLAELTNEQLLEYARNVQGSTKAPMLSSVPIAFRRLAEMVDEKEQ